MFFSISILSCLKSFSKDVLLSIYTWHHKQDKIKDIGVCGLIKLGWSAQKQSRLMVQAA